MSKDTIPHYDGGLFNRRCEVCGEKTQERIQHVLEDWTGFSEVNRYPEKPKLVIHYACHDTTCDRCDDSMRRNSKLIKIYNQIPEKRREELREFAKTELAKVSQSENEKEIRQFVVKNLELPLFCIQTGSSPKNKIEAF